MLVIWMNRFFERRESVYEWRVMDRNREGIQWDARSWKSEIDRADKCVGLSGRLRWNRRTI